MVQVDKLYHYLLLLFGTEEGKMVGARGREEQMTYIAIACIVAATTFVVTETKVERLRQVAIKKTELDIAWAEGILEMTKNSKVDRIKARVPSKPDDKIRYYGTASLRAGAIKGWEKTLAGYKKKLAVLKGGGAPSWPQLNHMDIKVGTVGTIDSKEYGFGAEVVQIIDDQTAIIRFAGNKNHRWAKLPTAGMVDGSEVHMEGVWEVTETKAYQTAVGSRRTIFVIERAD